MSQVLGAFGLLDFTQSRQTISPYKAPTDWFLSAFIKLRKPSVCPSVRMEQTGSHRTDFHYIRHLSIFRKSVEKIQVSLKSEQNNGTSSADRRISLNFFYE
jgi:hypothetical protein